MRCQGEDGVGDVMTDINEGQDRQDETKDKKTAENDVSCNENRQGKGTVLESLVSSLSLRLRSELGAPRAW